MEEHINHDQSQIHKANKKRVICLQHNSFSLEKLNTIFPAFGSAGIRHDGNLDLHKWR